MNNDAVYYVVKIQKHQSLKFKTLTVLRTYINNNNYFKILLILITQRKFSRYFTVKSDIDP